MLRGVGLWVWVLLLRLLPCSLAVVKCLAPSPHKTNSESQEVSSFLEGFEQWRRRGDELIESSLPACVSWCCCSASAARPGARRLKSKGFHNKSSQSFFFSPLTQVQCWGSHPGCWDSARSAHSAPASLDEETAEQKTGSGAIWRFEGELVHPAVGDKTSSLCSKFLPCFYVGLCLKVVFA